ncbi:uncharacterized protein FTOL_00234 [Fusarium torulosum]|uniref:Uncharacterized protein n=1 Tax=Fusarium torulosum TaxID=33205 RepID=A0AAE8LXP5_9HYPO|nr:uncharacterized protein FTOL_00234 [Fusarium torulosum]
MANTCPIGLGRARRQAVVCVYSPR